MNNELDDDETWAHWKAQWGLRPETIYLNHGSFGPPPRVVQEARRNWQERLDEQPMDFFMRQYEIALDHARARLGDFVGTKGENLVFVENATAGMNVVARSLRLEPHEEVLLTDHEYGAVRRIWEREAKERKGPPPRIVELPRPIESAEQVVEAIFAAVRDETRLLVVSHITSPTAITRPVKAICERARRIGVQVCIDGPHAPAQVEVQLEEIGCDYYAASLHKWLSAPFGSGFLYVHPARQKAMQPVTLSWGRVNHEQHPQPWRWDDEFYWSGTRDPSPYLAVPAAIDFLQEVGLEAFRERSHALARYARTRLVERFGQSPLVPDDRQWYTSMAHVPLQRGDADALRTRLWQGYGIEVPIIAFQGERYVRVSCHLYNTRAQIDRLVEALTKEV